MKDILFLVIRVDAHVSTGSGHAMRCLALAQAVRASGGEALFVMAMDAGPLFRRIEKTGIKTCRITDAPASINDAVHTANIAIKENAHWVVLDGYNFTSEYQKILKNAGLKLIVVDDNRDYDHYYADIILNNNIYANVAMYPRDCLESYTRLLLGWSYYLMRKEFIDAVPSLFCPEFATKILVTMGGSDCHNVMKKVLEAVRLLNIPNLQIKVLVGDHNPHLKSLSDYCACFSGQVELLCDVENMAELMSWADVAVSAAGNTCYELIYMMVPSLILVVAQNQLAFADKANALGVCKSLGWFNNVSSKQIADELRLFIFNITKRKEQKEKQKYLRDLLCDKPWLLNLESGVL